MKKNNLKIRSVFFTIFVFLILVFVGNVFAAPCLSPGGCGVYVPSDLSGLPNRSFEEVLVGILNWLLGIIGVVALISFAISGVMYLVSTGNDDMIKKAKATMQYSIIGVIVALGSVIAVQFIDSMLNNKL